jgi:hypothetical protein
MALDDFLEPEVVVAVAVTAAVASPPVRKALRKGLVYGLAGLLMAGDRITSATREIVRSAQQTVAPAEGTARGTAENDLAPPPQRVVTA